jgi:hypothetical protein
MYTFCRRTCSVSGRRVQRPDEKEIRAMFLDRLRAVVTFRWCLAQFPVMRRGMIFPLSVMNIFSILTSL